MVGHSVAKPPYLGGPEKDSEALPFSVWAIGPGFEHPGDKIPASLWSPLGTIGFLPEVR